MEHFDDVVDWVEWMILIGKQDVVEDLEYVLVLQDEVEQSCNHKVNHAKLVDKIGGGYIEIGMAALTYEYSITNYESKRMEMKCFEPYLQAMISMVFTLLQLPYLFDMLLPSQIRKNKYLWDAPFGNEGKTLNQILDFFEPAKHSIMNLKS